MTRMVLADTGPLYAAMNPRDQYHQQAQQEMRYLDSEGWEVGVLVSTLLETYSLILRNLPAQFALQWIEDIETGAMILQIATDDIRSAFIRVGRYPDQSITLFDALLAVNGERLGLPVWTFDHHFNILGAPRWYPGL